ncbi:putative uncharacterized protein DDB_G0286901 isoform X2 [Centruroides sculpturatus]|uniref:putative uncharacterized protein DDB_G0286901 isoform X2 n=1 Tax=Centruroides sculpturatus TaxID=218467 RepID=UPI000C6EE28C|nr:putative uncharacterized protein DDB_G0286901 isoform X2 [Centruroides sculpturatus]
MARKIKEKIEGKAKTELGKRKKIVGKKKRTKTSPKKNTRMIPDFIIPHLKKKTFGKLLEWENEKEGIFKLFWKHQSSGDWKEEHCEVFKAWSIMKENYNENDPNKYTKAKDRFRNALNKLEVKDFLEKILLEDNIIYYQLKDLNRNESNEVQMQASAHENNNNYSNQIDNTSPPNVSENLNENVQEMQNQVEQKSNPLWNENILVTSGSTVSDASHDTREIHQHNFEIVDCLDFLADYIKKIGEKLFHGQHITGRNVLVETLTKGDLQLMITKNREKNITALLINFNDTSSGSEQDLDNLQTDVLTNNDVLLQDASLSENHLGNIFHGNVITSDNRPENQSVENETNIFAELKKWESNRNENISDTKNPSNCYQNRSLNLEENCDSQTDIKFNECKIQFLDDNEENEKQTLSHSLIQTHSATQTLVNQNNWIQNQDSQNNQITAVNEMQSLLDLSNVKNNYLDLISSCGDKSPTENNNSFSLEEIDELLADIQNFSDSTDPSLSLFNNEEFLGTEEMEVDKQEMPSDKTN